VLNRETLGLIWAGNITQWRDQRILDLNQNISARLPNAPILLGYGEDAVISEVEVFKLALESFSADFRAVSMAADREFSKMPPALAGNAVDAGNSTSARLSWLQVRSFCLWLDDDVNSPSLSLTLPPPHTRVCSGEPVRHDIPLPLRVPGQSALDQHVQQSWRTRDPIRELGPVGDDRYMRFRTKHSVWKQS
jgi:hypothetical protein